MKRLSIVILAVLTLIICCGNAPKQGLKEFSKPHLGEYFCKSVLVNGEEKIDSFKEIKLTLKPKGKMVIKASEKNGLKKTAVFNYSYKDDCLEVDGGNIASRLEKGVITLSYTIGTLNITAKFSRN